MDKRVELALGIARKNLVSIICGTVALLSLVSLLYPLSGMRQSFKVELSQKVGDWRKATGLLEKPRQLPIVDVNQPEGAPLTSFPTQKVIEAGKDAAARVADQSVKMMEQAVAMNMAGHTVLLPDALPDPGDRVFSYRNAYLKAIHEDIPTLLGAVMPPNEDAIKRKLDELHKSLVDDRVININGVDKNRVQLEQDFKEVSAGVPDQLRRDSALNNKLFMDPDKALSINPVMNNQTARPTPADVWYAQLSLWIQQDVANSVVAANSILPNSNVLSDAVKRVASITVAGNSSAYLRNGGAGPMGSSPPTGAPAAIASPTLLDFSNNPFGHVCNDLYDVVQFSVELDVDERQIPTILHAFQKYKLLDVNSVDVSTIDANAANMEGFIYGSAPMVRLKLQCDELFLRSWTMKLMPDEVKQRDLGIGPPTALR